MSYSKDLYCNGFINLSFSKEDSIKKLHSTINNMNSENIKEDFFWESKYPNTQDFRPTVFEYDEVFLDVLFDNNIHKIINSATQKQLFLTHIQLRRVFPGPSYMNWHRDTYYKNREIVGSSPPGYKIIFFPEEDSEKCTPCLRVVKGSNNCQNPSQSDSDMVMPGFSMFDQQILRSDTFENISLESSYKRCMFFNTSMLHAAEPSNNVSGQLRLIYVFVPEEQFNERYADKDHHANLYKKYQEKLLNE
jgi:hypothetical protein